MAAHWDTNRVATQPFNAISHPIDPTYDWKPANTTNYVGKSGLYTKDPQARLIDKKVVRFTNDVLKYNAGTAEARVNRFIGHIGKTVQLDQVKPSVRLLGTRRAGEPAKLVAEIRIPRDQSTPWFADPRPEHHARIEFTADNFIMDYKFSDQVDMDGMRESSGGRLDHGQERLVALRFRRNNGQILTSGFNWPFKPAFPANCPPQDELIRIRDSKDWAFIVPWEDSWRLFLRNFGHTFACDDYQKTTADQYRHGEVVQILEQVFDDGRTSWVSSSQISYDNWEDLVLRNGTGVVQDFLPIRQYINKLRDIKVPMQFFRVHPEDNDTFLVSFSMPSIAELGKNAHSFMSVEDSVQIKFHDRPTGYDPATHKPIEDADGWKGVLVERPEFPGHNGTHLARVLRKSFGSVQDDTEVSTADVWSPDADYVVAYVVPEEADRTVKARVNAFNKSDPRKLRVQPKTREEREIEHDGGELIYGPGDDDGETYYDDEESAAPFVKRDVDYHNQQSILVGREVGELWSYDLFDGLSEDMITSFLETCTPLQRAQFRAVAREIPCGLFLVIGPGGTGKSTMIVRVIFILLKRKVVPLVTSSTNVAVNNICRRAEQENDDEEYLFVRLHPEHLEYARIISWRPKKSDVDAKVSVEEEVEELEIAASEKTVELEEADDRILVEQLDAAHLSPSVDGDTTNPPTTELKQTKRAKKYDWNHSVARRVLQSIGLIETTNPKLVALQNKNTWLKEIMLKEREKLTLQEQGFLPRLIQNAIGYVIGSADVIFTTLITSTSKWIRDYREKVGSNITDEGGSVTLPEVLIAWEGDCPLMLVGDDN
ncbi:hypothetical protein VTL71DRAFT_7737 [Oculimacula yallundae]|uniref:DNA2/NAM7 helicase helicase domain-containing protein n=1 Tax=Oculimacula yallundae TaxID=86028 RepID=A0ABR4CVJ0_9HELO